MRNEAVGRAAHEREGGGQVVVLHRCSVIVSQRERVAAVHKEFVRSAAVLNVMDYLGKKSGEMGEG